MYVNMVHEINIIMYIIYLILYEPLVQLQVVSGLDEGRNELGLNAINLRAKYKFL